MLFPTVVLYASDGTELTREDGIEGMKRAKERAAYLLSDRYAVAASFPNLIVGVKMGCSARFCCPIKDAHARIAALEKANPADYCREIFLPVSVLDSLRAALGMGKDV